MSPVIRLGLDLFRLAVKFTLLWNEYILSQSSSITLSPFYLDLDFFFFRLRSVSVFFPDTTVGRPSSTLPPSTDYPSFMLLSPFPLTV